MIETFFPSSFSPIISKLNSYWTCHSALLFFSLSSFFKLRGRILFCNKLQCAFFTEICVGNASPAGWIYQSTSNWILHGVVQRAFGWRQRRRNFQMHQRLLQHVRHYRVGEDDGWCRRWWRRCFQSFGLWRISASFEKRHLVERWRQSW